MVTFLDYNPGDLVMHRERVDAPWSAARVYGVGHSGGAAQPWTTLLTLTLLDESGMATGETRFVNDTELADRVRRPTDESAISKLLTTLETATGKGLDYIGDLFGVRRSAMLDLDFAATGQRSDGVIGTWRDVEPDVSYRERIVATVKEAAEREAMRDNASACLRRAVERAMVALYARCNLVPATTAGYEMIRNEIACMLGDLRSGAVNVEAQPPGFLVTWNGVDCTWFGMKTSAARTVDSESSASLRTETPAPGHRITRTDLGDGRTHADMVGPGYRASWTEVLRPPAGRPDGFSQSAPMRTRTTRRTARRSGCCRACIWRWESRRPPSVCCSSSKSWTRRTGRTTWRTACAASACSIA